MTNWKQGDKCEYNCPQLHDDAEFWEGTIIAKDAGMWVVACSEQDIKSPAYNGFPESCLRPIKAPAEIERDRVKQLAIDNCERLFSHGAYYDSGISFAIDCLDKANMLSDPAKRVRGISFNAFYHDLCSNKTYRETYNRWVEDGIIQGVDSNG